MEQRDNEIFRQKPGSQYPGPVMWSKLLYKATTRVNRRIGATEQEKLMVAYAESDNSYLNKKHEPTFCIIVLIQILCQVNRKYEKKLTQNLNKPQEIIVYASEI